MKIGDLVDFRQWRQNRSTSAHKLGIVVDHAASPPIKNISCFDGPTGQSRTGVAWCDGSGLQWVNTSDLTKG